MNIYLSGCQVNKNNLTSHWPMIRFILIYISKKRELINAKKKKLNFFKETCHSRYTVFNYLYELFLVSIFFYRRLIFTYWLASIYIMYWSQILTLTSCRFPSLWYLSNWCYITLFFSLISKKLNRNYLFFVVE